MKTVLDNRKKAIIWMVINCFFGTLVNVLVKYLCSDIPVPQIVASYNAGCFVIVSIIMLILGISPKSPKIKLHLLRGFLCSSAFLIYFSALKSIAIANAVAITFIDPMLTCIFAYIFLRDKIEKENIIGLIAGFIGALLIIKPGTGLFKAESMIILISTVLWALSNVVMKLLTQSEHSLVQIFYMSLTTALVSSSAFHFFAESAVALSGYSLLFIILTSISVLLHYFAIYKAFSLANASEVMPFFFMNIIFSEIFGSLLFGEKHDLYEMLGIGVIILTNIFLLINSRKKVQPVKTVT
ncbi:MAG: EamA-like transporter family protein [Rickettsiaceae bacterium]|jgi:drug/metabolite transporter (DMT)-like permease|nr:EamA-like transporter family protein [Rickettsiaceae bacterium]